MAILTSLARAVERWSAAGGTATGWVDQARGAIRRARAEARQRVDRAVAVIQAHGGQAAARRGPMAPSAPGAAGAAGATGRKPAGRRPG